jgi:hypothetical protein
MNKPSYPNAVHAIPRIAGATADEMPPAADQHGRPVRSSQHSHRTRANMRVFILLCGACLLVSAGYVGWAILRNQFPSLAPAGSGVPVENGDGKAIAALQALPHVVFRNLAPGRGSSDIALTPLAASSGKRTLVAAQCERVYMAAGQGLCVGAHDGATVSDVAYTFGSDFQPRHRLQLGGFPSRARVSPDGRYGATTVFVTGHSYNEAGFSTLTNLIDMATGTVIADLEQFEVVRDGSRFSSPDFNFWGVTFARDSNRFYATLGSGGKTYLVEGDISARRVRVLRENVECPSLSPDNERLAFKKRVGVFGQWRLHILDLATLEDQPLAAETRAVDDQVEWLDNNQILYRWGQDVMILATDGSAPPRTFLAQAASPAVER